MGLGRQPHHRRHREERQHHHQADAIGVTGCSRYGKGAFIAGVLDQRIALTMPIESGTAGVPIWRGIAKAENGENGKPSQSLTSAYSEQPWFGDAFQPFLSNPRTTRSTRTSWWP